MTSGTAGAYGLTLYTVQTPAGGEVNVQTPEEATWYEDRRNRYMADNIFTNVSDLQELDRLLTLEVLAYRWGFWMAQGFDYQMSRVDETDLSKKIREYSAEIRNVKLALGIDKSTRDREKGESLADYTEKLLTRAKEFGYHRNKQYELAVTRFYELRAMVRTYDRCDDEERQLLDLSMESIMDWIRLILEDWDQTSDAFRKQQSMWIRSM